MKIIEVAAGLVFREGKLLITQRFAHDHLGGLWEFPGGKLEPDESFEGCLVRELREELGIEILVGPLAEDLRHSYAEKTVHLRFFRCALGHNSAEPRPIGCAALAWITRDQLQAYDFPAADARILKKTAMSPAWWKESPPGKARDNNDTKGAAAFRKRSNR